MSKGFGVPDGISTGYDSSSMSTPDGPLGPCGFSPPRSAFGELAPSQVASPPGSSDVEEARVCSGTWVYSIWY